jgi:hypothetical protein
MARQMARLRRTAAACLLAAVLLPMALAVPSVAAEGVSPESLTAAGWSCVPAPPFIVPPRIVCANPGLGRPVPGTPAVRPAYSFVEFSPDGTLLGVETLIRGDLYRQQPCGPSGEPYVFRAPIGYYACLRP